MLTNAMAASHRILIPDPTHAMISVHVNSSSCLTLVPCTSNWIRSYAQTVHSSQLRIHVHGRTDTGLGRRAAAEGPRPSVRPNTLDKGAGHQILSPYWWRRNIRSKPTGVICLGLLFLFFSSLLILYLHPHRMFGCSFVLAMTKGAQIEIPGFPSFFVFSLSSRGKRDIELNKRGKTYNGAKVLYSRVSGSGIKGAAAGQEEGIQTAQHSVDNCIHLPAGLRPTSTPNSRITVFSMIPRVREWMGGWVA